MVALIAPPESILYQQCYGPGMAHGPSIPPKARLLELHPTDEFKRSHDYRGYITALQLT